MKKRYFCANELSFNIKVNGSKKHIIFNMLTSGGSDYITANEQEQIAIEGVRGFGTLFNLVDVTAVDELIEIDKESVLIDIPELHNCADAKAWLREQGVKGGLNSRIDICEAALALGYTFSNL